MRGHRHAGPIRLPDFARHFSSPKIPKPEPPPPPPQPTDKGPEEAVAKEKKRHANRQGRASTLLAGDTLGAGGTLG